MRTLALTLALASTVVAVTAHAEPTTGIGVVVTGDATLQPQTEAQVVDWLRQRGHSLAAAPLRPDALTAMIDCFVIEDLACAKKVFDTQASSSELVFAKLDLAEGRGGSRDVTITAYWFSQGSEPMAVRRVCAACTNPRVTLDDMMTSLAGKGRAAQGMFELVTTPAGARVTVDGKDVGASPIAVPLAQGTHELVVRHAGYATKTAQVTVVEGQSSKLEVILDAESPRGALPYIVGAAGAALLGTGIVLYATSEEDTGEKPEYRDTKALGIGLVGAGVVTVGVATWLFLRGQTVNSSAGPTVGYASGHATVGWAGAF